MHCPAPMAVNSNRLRKPLQPSAVNPCTLRSLACLHSPAEKSPLHRQDKSFVAGHAHCRGAGDPPAAAARPEAPARELFGRINMHLRTHPARPSALPNSPHLQHGTCPSCSSPAAAAASAACLCCLMRHIGMLVALRTHEAASIHQSMIIMNQNS